MPPQSIVSSCLPGLGERLRRLREARGLSGADLSRMSGLSPALINKIERGDRAPLLTRAVALAHALGVGLADLVGPAAHAPLDGPPPVPPRPPRGRRPQKKVEEKV